MDKCCTGVIIRRRRELVVGGMGGQSERTDRGPLALRVGGWQELGTESPSVCLLGFVEDEACLEQVEWRREDEESRSDRRPVVSRVDGESGRRFLDGVGEMDACSTDSEMSGRAQS